MKTTEQTKNRVALKAAAKAIQILADNVKQVADCYGKFANSAMSDQALRPFLEGANGYMEAIGNLLNAHDAVDDELVAETTRAFELVHEALGIDG